MARRGLLNEEERQLLFGVTVGRDALARLYTFDRSDLELIAARRGDTNRLGFAVQLALLRHPGFGLSLVDGTDATLVAYIAKQLEIPPIAFADYAARLPIASEHARELERVLGLRPSTKADLPLMIEAAARAAGETEKGLPIAAGIIEFLRSEGIILPPPQTIERAGLAGRARARTRAAEALLQGMSEENLASLDALLVVDAKTGRAPLSSMKDVPSAPKADHVREILDKLTTVRQLGIDRSAAGRVHPERLRNLVREGRSTPAYWNSTYIADAVEHLRRGGDPAPDRLLVHTSPVEWEHIGFSGDFLWDRAAVLPTGRRPLNLPQERRAACVF